MYSIFNGEFYEGQKKVGDKIALIYDSINKTIDLHGPSGHVLNHLNNFLLTEQLTEHVNYMAVSFTASSLSSSTLHAINRSIMENNSTFLEMAFRDKRSVSEEEEDEDDLDEDDDDIDFIDSKFREND